MLDDAREPFYMCSTTLESFPKSNDDLRLTGLENAEVSGTAYGAHARAMPDGAIFGDPLPADAGGTLLD